MRSPWQRPLPCNGPLDIQQLWASGGRTREPIFMKFGIQQEIRTTMTVTWSNIILLNSEWRSVVVGKYSKCHNSLPMDRLGGKSGGRIPSCSQFWKCYNSSYDGTDWDDSWVVASKQHFCYKTVPLVLVVTANRTVNVPVFWGVEIKNIHNFGETWMTVPLWYKKNKIWWKNSKY